MGCSNHLDAFDPNDVLTAEGVVRAALAAYYETVKFHARPPTEEVAAECAAEDLAWSCPEDFAQHLAASIASRIVAQVVERTGVPFGFNVGEFNVPQESHCHG